MTDTPTTDSVVLDMLKENTGRHMLDSGGAYGRAWEKNQSVDFSAVPATSLSFKYGIEVTHDLYHWLPERLNYEAKADAAFYEWASANDDYWLQNMEQWVEILGGTGLYGDGKPMTVNTYNGEDLLSQTIQYTYFTLEDEVALPAPGATTAGARDCGDCDGEGTVEPDGEGVEVDCMACDGRGSFDDEEAVTLGAGSYVLLQIHGGADVRGGYTRPRLFSVASDDETALFDNARATISCSDDRDHYWTTDDGCNWYFDGSTGHTNLEDYDRTEVGLGGVEVWTYTAENGIDPGTLVVDTDTDTGYCPRCGVGTLQAS